MRPRPRVLAVLAGSVLVASAASAQVRISAVYGGGGASTGSPTFNRDYIEIFNAGAAPVALGTWSVQYAASTGTTWSRFNLPAISIGPGEYRLIAVGSTGTAGAPLPVTPDAATTSLAMAATSGKVALCNNQTTLTTVCPTSAAIQDLVGYGTANCFETQSTAVLSTTTAANRQWGGCYDTGSNAADFTLGTPAPRNSTTPASPCSGGPGSDLSVFHIDPSDCTFRVGAELVYNVTVRNNGNAAEAASTLNFNFGAGATFTSASLPAMNPAPGVVVVDLPALNPAEQVTFEVRLNALAQGVLSVNTQVVAGGVVAVNNSFATQNLISPAILPVVGSVVFSTVASSPTSDIPGLPGRKFSDSAGGFGRPVRSADGAQLLMAAFTDSGVATQNEILIRSNGTIWETVVQEGVTVTTEGPIVGDIGTGYSIINSGAFAYNADTDAPTASDEMIIRSDGVDHTPVVREGNTVPAFSMIGFTYGSTSGNTNLHEDGSLAFTTNLAGPPTSLDTVVARDNGNVSVLQEGNDAPTNSIPGGSTNTWKLFQSTEGLGLYVNPTSMDFRYILSGQLNITPTSLDGVVVVDNQVKIQEGVALTALGFSSPVSTNTSSFVGLNPDGGYAALSRNADGQGFVLVDDAIVARTGGAIGTTGFNYSNARLSETFYSYAKNNRGNFVLMGGTDSADALSDAFLVLNGETIILRENSPIDINNNGLADDDAYLAIFRDEKLFIDENNILYLVVRIRDQNAYCTGSNSDFGQALLRIDLNPFLPATCLVDFNDDGFLNQEDLSGYLTAFLDESVPPGPSGTGVAPCPGAPIPYNTLGYAADFNRDCNFDQEDLSGFITEFFQQSENPNGCILG